VFRVQEKKCSAFGVQGSGMKRATVPAEMNGGSAVNKGGNRDVERIVVGSMRNVCSQNDH
jgi:hypothetical protein